MSNGQWIGKHSRRIQQRIIVQGMLVLQTPAQFGSGDGDDLTDMPLLVDAYDGVSPLLTGATLAGALRAYLHSREQGYRQPDKPDKDTLTELLFGGFKGDDDGGQSALIVDDVLGENYSVELRDGVRLDPQTRTAFVEVVETDDGKTRERGHLFDMQVWSAGTTFPIRLELLLTVPKRKNDESDAQYSQRRDKQFTRLKEALLTSLQGLTDGGITLGGRKNRGYGRISVTHWHVREYDLTQPTQLMAWLIEGDKPLAKAHCVNQLEKANTFAGLKPAADRRRYFQMKATFKLDGSLLIRATGQPHSNSPDMVHLSNHAGEPVLPGTSVTGALRQRSRRILRLIDPAPENWQKPHPTKKGEFVRADHEWLAELFGDEEMRGNFKASRLIVEETIIEEPQFDLVQNRVAIDRFTGGALESALFNQQPVFGTADTRLKINLRLLRPAVHEPDEKKREQAEKEMTHSYHAQIGLLLLLLKDLWTGGLPLGGEISVGRGRLSGLYAELALFEQGQTQTWTIERIAEDDRLQMADGTAEDLQKFVDALHGKGEESGAEN